jgi:hypothetical protein
MIFPIVVTVASGLILLAVYIWLLKSSLQSYSYQYIPKQLFIITVALLPIWISFLALLWGIYNMDEAALQLRAGTLAVICGLGIFTLNGFLFDGGRASPDGSAEFAVSGLIVVLTSIFVFISLFFC